MREVKIMAAAAMQERLLKETEGLSSSALQEKLINERYVLETMSSVHLEEEFADYQEQYPYESFCMKIIKK